MTNSDTKMKRKQKHSPAGQPATKSSQSGRASSQREGIKDRILRDVDARNRMAKVLETAFRRVDRRHFVPAVEEAS